jgi:hypothetical protein
MNERIKQLAEQAGLNVKTNISGVPLVFGTFEGYKTSHITVEELEKFAELIAKERKHQWQGLTDDDVNELTKHVIAFKSDIVDFIRRAEAKLKEKNT